MDMTPAEHIRAAFNGLVIRREKLAAALDEVDRRMVALEPAINRIWAGERKAA